MRRAILLCVASTALSVTVANAQNSVAARSEAKWIDPGAKGDLPALASHQNVFGELGVLNANGAVAMDGHPFFAPLGTNGRACVSCHQPAYAMSVSAAGLQERWRVT